MNYYVNNAVISIKSLKNNLILFLPSLLFYLFTLIFGMVILFLFGMPLVEIITKTAIQTEIANQLKEHLSNFGNIVKLVTSAVLFIIVTFFLGASIKAIELNMFKDVIKKGKTSLKNAMNNVFRYYWKIIGVKIVLFLISTLFMAVIGLLSLLGIILLGSKLMLALSPVLLIILVLFFVYIRLWFFFIYPIIVFDNKSLNNSIRHAHKYLRKNLSHTLFAWFTTFVATIVFSFIIGFINLGTNTLSEFLIDIFSDPLGVANAFVLITGLFLLLKSAVNLILYLWSNLFIFKCYR